MLTIPGVEITVVKELVPRGLGAAGVLGIVGCAERPNDQAALREVSSLSEFRDLFGAGSLASMPEVGLAFANGLKALVCASLPGSAGSPARRDVTFDMEDRNAAPSTSAMSVRARANGAWGDDLFVRFVTKGAGAAQSVDVIIYRGQADVRADRLAEAFRNLS